MTFAFALLWAIQVLFPIAVPVRAQANDGNKFTNEELWLDISIGAEFIPWINLTARASDIVRIDHVQMLPLLEEIQTGQRLVVVKTIGEAERLLPRIADDIDIIGYNLEHGPANDPLEQAAPVASVRQMRDLADAYSVRLAVGPDHSFALSHGVAMAALADIIILQVQKVQEEPAVVLDFVYPLVRDMRRANPELQISVQIGAQGDVDQLIELVNLLAPELDGVSILTDHSSVDFSVDFVAALRPGNQTLQPTINQEYSDPNNRASPVIPLSTALITQSQSTSTLIFTTTPSVGSDALPAASAPILQIIGLLVLAIFSVGAALTTIIYVLPRSR